MILYKINGEICYEDIGGTNGIRCVPGLQAEFDDISASSEIKISIFRYQGREHKNFFEGTFLYTAILNENGGAYGSTFNDVVSGWNSAIGIKLDTNSASGDAFGRLRVSSPYQLFDSKELDGSQARIWDEQLGVYGFTTHDIPNSQWILSAPSSGSFAIRQTKQRFPYQAGKSQLALLTGVMPTVTNTRCSIGLAEEDQSTNASPYEIYNGIYWQNANDGTTAVDGMHVCITKNGVHDKIHQDDWNIDKMDGSGSSGITADWEKAQIFGFDFEWLGVGRVRFHLNINGVGYVVHEFDHSNIVTTVYVKIPNLPVRYEARSTGGDVDMQKICASIQSEGGVDVAGIMHIGSSALDVINDDTAGTNNTVLAAVRLQSLKPYSALKLISFSGLSFANASLRWSIALVPGDFEISINGTPTAIDDLVGSIDLPDTTVNFWEANASGQDTILEATISPFTIEEGFLGAAGQTSDTADISPVDNLLTVGKDMDGSRSTFVLYAQGYGANTLRYALKFKESL